MQATNLLKKVLKPRNLTPGTPTTPSAQASGGGGGGGGGSSSGGGNKKENVTRATSDQSSKPACTCSPTTHAGSFRCHLHRGSGVRSHGLTPGAMPKTGDVVPNKPFRGSSSYTISSLDIQYQVPRSSIAPKPSPSPGIPCAAKNCHRHNHHHHHNSCTTNTNTTATSNANANNKPSRLSRMEKAPPVIESGQVETLKSSDRQLFSDDHRKCDEMARQVVMDESIKRVMSPGLDSHEDLVAQARKAPDEMYAFGSGTSLLLST